MSETREIAINEYYSNEIAHFERCILFIKTKFMDYLLTMTFYYTIEWTMSGSFVKRFINSLGFCLFKFVLERGRPFCATYNRANVNRHSFKFTSIDSLNRLFRLYLLIHRWLYVLSRLSSSCLANTIYVGNNGTFYVTTKTLFNWLNEEKKADWMRFVHEKLIVFSQ